MEMESGGEVLSMASATAPYADIQGDLERYTYATQLVGGGSNEQNVCIICGCEEPVSSRSFEETHQLKILIEQTTGMDLALTSKLVGTVCDCCGKWTPVLQNAYESFRMMQYKLQCLSTAISYRILNTCQNNRRRDSHEKKNYNDIAWVTQFHEWNLSRLENFCDNNKLNSATLLKDGSQLLAANETEINGERGDVPSGGHESCADTCSFLENSCGNDSGSNNKWGSKSLDVVIDGKYSQEDFQSDHQYLKCKQTTSIVPKEKPDNNSLASDSYKCNLCDKVYSHEKSLRFHVKKIHNGADCKPRGGTCPICKKHLSQRGKLIYHILRFHQSENYQCTTCDRLFESPKMLLAHLSVHEGKYRCSKVDCTRYFNSMRKMKLHEDVHLRNETVTICDLCNCTFRTKFACDSHFAHKHSRWANAKDFACKKCGFPLQTTDQLKMHTKTCRMRSYKCQICDKEFNQKSHFEDHMLRHSSVKPFRCSICKEAFYRKAQAITHQKDKHPDLDNTAGAAFIETTNIVLEISS